MHTRAFKIAGYRNLNYPARTAKEIKAYELRAPKNPL